MKRLLNLSASCLSALALIFAAPDASARRPGATGPETTRPSNGIRPGATRPGNSHNSGGSHRPGNSTKPDNNHRPNNNFKPDNGHRPPQVTPGTRPGNNHTGNGHYQGGNRPGSQRPIQPGWGNIGPSFSYPTPPPPRPYRPVMRPIPRPVRPAGWVVRPGIPAINGFLGLSFGAGLSVSLNLLNTNGYAVDGYADNTVYLRNVTELSMLWPDAALYYTPAGNLEASSFYYSTPYNDMSRYNSVYSRLTSIYGIPVNTGATGATWFGSTGYISLSYSASNTATGGLRYYTTLSYGQ